MGRKRAFRFSGSEALDVYMAVGAVVMLMFCIIIFYKVHKQSEPYESPQFAPPMPMGKYTGVWNKDLCHSVFQDPNFDAGMQKNCLNDISNPDCSDYPMHFCGGQSSDGKFECGVVVAAGTDSAGSTTCQKNYGMAFSDADCDSPLLSSGQMYCSSGPGFYNCDKICDAKSAPIPVDPASNMWGLDRACGNVQQATAGLNNCPASGNGNSSIRSSRMTKSSEKTSPAKMIVYVAVAVAVVVGLVMLLKR